MYLAPPITIELRFFFKCVVAVNFCFHRLKVDQDKKPRERKKVFFCVKTKFKARIGV